MPTALRKRHALGAPGAEAGVEVAQGLFAEKNIARIAPEQFPQPLRIFPRPGLGGVGPGIDLAHALLQQPLIDAAVGLVVRAGKGDTHGALRAVGLADPGDFTAGQGGAGLGQGVRPSTGILANGTRIKSAWARIMSSGNMLSIRPRGTVCLPEPLPLSDLAAGCGVQGAW